MRKMIFFLLLLTAGFSNSQSQQDKSDRKFDPPYKPSFSRSSVPSPVKTPGKKTIIKELFGYDKGYLTHPESFSFCKELATKIQDLVNSGCEIKLVVVKGFADGIPNRGLKYDIAKLPKECKENRDFETIDDTELAFLRGCLIWNLLSGLLEESVGSGIIAAWGKNEYYDEPDGGQIGYKYRKVSLEIIYND